MPPLLVEQRAGGEDRVIVAPREVLLRGWCGGFAGYGNCHGFLILGRISTAISLKAGV